MATSAKTEDRDTACRPPAHLGAWTAAAAAGPRPALLLPASSHHTQLAAGNLASVDGAPIRTLQEYFICPGDDRKARCLVILGRHALLPGGGLLLLQ